MLRTPNEDIRSLKELVHYGLKGMAAYVEHAHNLGYESPEIFAFMQHALSELTRNDITVEELVQLTLEIGSMEYRQWHSWIKRIPAATEIRKSHK